MDISTTNRGFRICKFVDQKGVTSSLQESSLAHDEACLWIGCDEINLRRFEPGKGWSTVELEDDPYGITHIANTRMHLTQSQIADLIHLLQYFVEHGRLPPPVG
jgi:hypothetical protein